jgi:hypothetical protein
MHALKMLLNFKKIKKIKKIKKVFFFYEHFRCFKRFRLNNSLKINLCNSNFINISDSEKNIFYNS